MLKRLYVPLTALTLVVGSSLALAGLSAEAASAAKAPAAVRAHTSGFVPGGKLILTPGGRKAAASGVTNQEVSSTNWSGYAATGSNGAFTSVSASWTQPSATCSSSSRRHSSDQYAAFWVGLDGYSSDSVEQTGTDSDCDGRTPDYYGWYEMYPADPVYYNNPVAPGDQISASVTFSGSDAYTLVLTDSTQGWTQKITIDESGFDRSSAEVITEAPSSNTGVLPLADFGTINYTSSSANGTALGSLSPTEIVMADSSGNQEDSTSAISGGSFSNTWLRSS
jgi:hypothetical protein